MMARLILTAALMLAAAPAVTQRAEVEAPLPPPPAWHGASERLIAPPGHAWITPAEASGFQTTPTYAETRAFIERLVAASPLLRIEPFGRSSEGRELYAVIASRNDGRDRPRVLVQAGIHGGEIDGKDAGLMLLRDITQRGRASLLDNVDLVLVPIFNVDGHERSSPFNRPNQRGPRSQGWRTTARNINLNRDYLKADSPEMQAMIGLIRSVDPVLYFDIHVTDGVDYQYDVTYGFQGREGRYAQSPAIGRWLDTVLRPNMDRALTRAGHIPAGLIFAIDDRNPAAGIADFAAQPRLSHAYGDFARVPTVLVENHSLKPYRQRVLGTYVLMEEALRLAATHGANLRQAIAADRAARPGQVILGWRPSQRPGPTIPWRGIAYESYQSPISGRQEVRWLGRPQDSTMRVLVQEPSLTVALPRAWWVPASRPEVIERLRLHGVQFETLATSRTARLEMTRLVDPQLQPASEGHVPMRVASTRREQRAQSFPTGSVRVPADQPLALIAAALLEPESPDSLLAWGFFADILQRTEYIEGYAVEPLAQRMIEARPALALEFQAAVAADPELASDADRRLQWFYERSAYYDDRYLLYPIGRELN
jgi:hypothetical protein